MAGITALALQAQKTESKPKKKCLSRNAITRSSTLASSTTRNRRAEEPSTAVCNRCRSIRSATNAAVGFRLLPPPPLLCIFSPDGENSANLILAVSIHQRVHEKHFVSRLNFSWPQMACVSQSSIRGSRVVFASYNDSTGQMQKFAMRFANSSESQTFINSVKDHLRDMGNSKSPLQLQDDFIPTLNEGHYRGNAAVEVKQGPPAGNETFSKSYPIQALLDHKGQCKFSEESTSLGEGTSLPS